MDQHVKEEQLQSPEEEQAKLNILVVEDEEIIRILIERFIRINTVASQVGLIEKASNGQEAFDILEKNKGKFNIVLTDGHMPRMGGLELAKKIKASGEDIIVGLMSADMKDLGLGNPETQASVMRDCGIAAVLPKPLDLSQFGTFMEHLITIKAGNSPASQSQTP